MVVLEVCGVWCVCVTVRVWLDDISRWRRHVAGLRNTNVTRTGAEREYVVWISAGNRLTSPLCRLDSSSKRLLRPGSKISDGRVSCFDVWDPQRGKYEDYVTACALVVRVRLKYDGTLAETRFRLSAKRTSPLKSAGGRQFSRLLAAEVCASEVVMLDTPCSEVVWRVLAAHFIRQFPLQFPSSASPCATTFQLDCTNI